jgi:hypothetical protein
MVTRTRQSSSIDKVAPPIESLILLVRDQRVMIDTDLAALYGVSTKWLNEQVSRNAQRFPGDFCFRLSAAGKAEVVANCDHLGRLRFLSSLPKRGIGFV